MAEGLLEEVRPAFLVGCRLSLGLGFEIDRRLASFYDDGTAALRLVRRE